jgi:hypothetical protein
MMIGALLLLMRPASADELKNLAQELYRLRSDLGALNTQLEAQEQALRAQRQSAALREMDLQSAMGRERTKLAGVKKKILEKQSAQRQLLAPSASYHPLVLQSIDRLKEKIRSSLPFKTADRLRELDKIRADLSSKAINGPKALTLLWAFFEDELRLRREMGIFQQTVTVDGKELLAEVVRLGMVMMFFKTATDQYGEVERGPSGYHYVFRQEPQQQRQLQQLFTAMKRGGEAGYFELPTTLLQQQGAQP